MQEQFQSSVGRVVDIATPSKRKLRALGLLWVLIALFPIAIINYLVIQALTSSEPLVTSKPISFFGSLLMPVMAWFALGSAVQRFRALRRKSDISDRDRVESQCVFPMTIPAGRFVFRSRTSSLICHGISMCPSSLISDIRNFIVIGVGGVFLLLSFAWIETVQDWLGDFAGLAPVVLIAVCAAAAGLTAGLFQLPISLLRLLTFNKQLAEAQKQGIKSAIHEAII
jgi:hypothetical protein